MAELAQKSSHRSIKPLVSLDIARSSFYLS